MWTLRTLCLASIVTFLAFAGCDDSISPRTANLSGLPTLGELWDMCQASTAPDSDGDFVPDDIELGWLLTNPQDRDTDHDGLPDNYEIFGAGLFDPDAFVPDLDQDAKIAPLDNDDDNDFVNDGRYIDTDADGVPNYLEFYGYVYDWMTGMFVSCEDIDCGGLTVYRSDPLQPSTDQDPYGDGMEVSGARMDVSVVTPGDHPLVPAYPNLVVELVGYSVTLNEDITYGTGGSLSKGTEWSRQTSREHSHTTEVKWTGGFEVGLDGTDPVGKISSSLELGFSNTHTTGYSSSVGGSVTSEENWESSRSFNPTDAAHVTLLLKMHNYGTACATKITPTLTLRVAGLNVATFEPGGAEINMLVPGGTYPAEEGVYWVVDSAAGGAPISLTMTELRAFEKGAPIGVSLTQVGADVLLLTDGGGWESVGDCNEFMARCDAACANLRLDMGEGSFLHTLVYCGEGPSGPVVTLEDALRWTAYGYRDAGELYVSYLDKSGLPRTTSLQNWSFAFDRDTLIANGLDPDDLAGTVPPDFDLGTLVLFPDSTVVGKAPRSAEQNEPSIHFAVIDQDARTATVCASDYRGLEEVTIYVSTDSGSGPDVEEWPMAADALDATLYTYNFSDSEWPRIEAILRRAIDPVPGTVDVLQAKVYAVGGVHGERDFAQIPPKPRPVPPRIAFVIMDRPNYSLYANVVPDERYPDLWHETYPVQWVRAFHEGFPGGAIEMKPPVNAYEDVHGYECRLPAGFAGDQVKVVAYVHPGVYTERTVDASAVLDAYADTSLSLSTWHEWATADKWGPEGARLDKRGAGTIWSPDPDDFYGKSGWNKDWNPGPWVADFYARWADDPADTGWRLYFNVEHEKNPGPAFNNLLAAWIDGRLPPGSSFPQDHYVLGSPQSFEVGDIFIFRTFLGRVGKLEITHKKTRERNLWLLGDRDCDLTFHYVIFDRPVAIVLAADDVLIDKSNQSITLDGSGSTGAREWKWEIESSPTGANATIERADESIATLLPDRAVAGKYKVKLTINEGSATTQDSGSKTINVYFPGAKIDVVPSLNPVFDPTDDPTVYLKGEHSIGAKTYFWRITEWPDTSAKNQIPADDQYDENTSFAPDVSGEYVVELTVNKGVLYDEHKVTAKINVTFN